MGVAERVGVGAGVRVSVEVAVVRGGSRFFLRDLGGGAPDLWELHPTELWSSLIGLEGRPLPAGEKKNKEQK